MLTVSESAAIPEWVREIPDAGVGWRPLRAKWAKVEEGDGGAIVGLSSPIAPMFGAPDFFRFARFVIPRIPFQIVGINPGR
jgi:hypothetical protein